MKKRVLAFLMAILLLSTTAGAALTVEDARTLLERLYIDEIPEEVLALPTVEEIFDSLDIYTEYFSPEEYAAFLSTMNDVENVGLGVVSTMREDGAALVVEQVYPGGAAEAAGIQAGDQILAIDARPVSEAANIYEAGQWMRGEAGTQVTLHILRASGGEAVLTLVRSAFTIPYTEYELVDGHIGYISCTSFGEETYGHFTDAVEELGDYADRWVVDLRDNSGGYSQAAADAAGVFTGAGPQAMLRGRDSAYYGFFSEGEVSTMYPAILLVNEGTASAAEQMAASIRDGEAGLIIGGRTYGKGVAQTLVDQSVEPGMFADGDAVRITSYRFFSNEGVTNDKIGVLPHLMVADEYVDSVAYLLCQPSPGSGNEGYLRLNLGSWRWFVSLDQALNAGEGAWRPAFIELLEALWPDAEVYLGAGNGEWEQVTAGEVAERYGLEEYQVRGFDDVKDSPYQYALDLLKTYGILQGDEHGNFDPTGELTRAQLCALLSQAIHYEVEGESGFLDVAADAWYAPAVNAMSELGFIQGDGAGYFRPDEVLTNEQMMLILSRVAAWMSANLYEYAKEGPEEGALEAWELRDYSDWAKEGVWLLGRCQKNVFGSYISYFWAPVEDIIPTDPATRETTAYSLWRLMDIVGIMCE